VLDGLYLPDQIAYIRGLTPTRAQCPTSMSAPPELSTKVLDNIWGFIDGDDAECLPPPALVAEAHTQLLASLRPHIQQKATHATSGTPLVEPTLLVYCILDGGELCTRYYRVYDG
jgi:hypothetical protein